MSTSSVWMTSGAFFRLRFWLTSMSRCRISYDSADPAADLGLGRILKVSLKTSDMSRTLPRPHRAGYTADMNEIVDAQSGGTSFRVELDFESRRWSSALQPPPEGEFPFIAHFNGKRYEIYSDETFDEVEGGPKD
jgi:hypothetical protein